MNEIFETVSTAVINYIKIPFISEIIIFILLSAASAAAVIREVKRQK